MNFPFQRRPKPEIARLGRAELAEILLAFEDAYEAAAANRLSSPAFFELYQNGEVDSTFATAWGTYYEAFRRMDADESVVAHTAGLSPSLVTG